MNNNFWRPNTDQRRTILLLEALGLIHDLGKLSDPFLKKQAKDSTIKYKNELLVDPCSIPLYKTHILIPGNKASEKIQKWKRQAADPDTEAPFKIRKDLTNQLQNISLEGWDNQQYTLAELVLVTMPRHAYLLSKWQKAVGKTLQPGLLVGYLHGLSHMEKHGEPQENKQPYNSVYRATSFGHEEKIQEDELTTALHELPLDRIEDITTCKRSQWMREMREQMSKGIADNRRPHNEIPLWDWSYTTATLTKAAATQIFKLGWPSKLSDLAYRILRINLNKLDVYTRCNQIGDLTGTSKVIDDSFQRVRHLLEEVYALANCFYHDETGAYYLFPELQYDDEEITCLHQEIQLLFPPDLRPKVHLGESFRMGQLDSVQATKCSFSEAISNLVATPRAEVLQTATIRSDNNLYLFTNEWGKSRPSNAEICNACGIYPVGYPLQGSHPKIEEELQPWAKQDKAERRSICRVCLNRRGRRAQEWVENGLQRTIWLDEVADNNGKIALLVGKLDLDEWLSGSLVETIQVVSQSAKHPSPARLYRITETGRCFWHQVEKNLVPNVIGQRPFRLALYVSSDYQMDLGDYHAYELRGKGFSLSVVWDSCKNRFLTVENLDYFAQRWQISPGDLPEQLENQTLDVLSTDYNYIPKVRVVDVEKLDNYIPSIAFLTEPGLHMSLIPADKALRLVHAIKHKYEKEMGRVRDRLPLHLGLIICQRRMPLRTLLEAGRNMANMGGNGDRWEDRCLVNKRLSSDKQFTILKFHPNITWHIPCKAGDGTTEDEWYPRLYQGTTYERRKLQNLAELRIRDKKTPLDKGLKTWIKPSQFDFKILDTASRRFEINYNYNDKRHLGSHHPYYLEDLDRFAQLWELFSRLSRTQRHQVLSTIELTRERWYGRHAAHQSQSDPVFKQFVKDTLAGAEWPKTLSWRCLNQELQELLVHAGFTGELVDITDLYEAF